MAKHPLLDQPCPVCQKPSALRLIRHLKELYDPDGGCEEDTDSTAIDCRYQCPGLAVHFTEQQLEELTLAFAQKAAEVDAQQYARHYGGLGGVPGGRPLDPTNPFELIVEHGLGPWIRESEGNATAMWRSLANVRWDHPNGDSALFSFRAAGDLVAAIRGEGDYLKWYCTGPDGQVHERVQQALGLFGWIADAQPSSIPTTPPPDLA